MDCQKKPGKAECDEIRSLPNGKASACCNESEQQCERGKEGPAEGYDCRTRIDELSNQSRESEQKYRRVYQDETGSLTEGRLRC
ncbi:hypothetical protein DAMNIGENAA_11790 [Desulforhabdus amnigena]|uniref:Uncharacterized protein n=1 Tax=Desulforhabdus amnigena TaxID=40218 RepID=A0A9W6D5L0_9BACT|nr:hypothetical protein DAMNIGENAA_11790 [Desulforhabdus amnigena]